MLLYLQALDVDVSEHEANQYTDADEPHPDLDVKTSSKGVSSDHKCSYKAYRVQK